MESIQKPFYDVRGDAITKRRVSVAGHFADRAGGVAFGDPRLQVAVPGGDVAAAMADGEARVVELVEAIEAGVYPPRPVERSLCASCAFPTVCRKDHVDEA